jgi:hypothetical protein
VTVDLEQSVTRIIRWIVLIGGAGAAVAWTIGGWTWGVAFLFGAFASYLNFHWLRRLVENLGPATMQKPPRTRTAVVLGLRYLLLGLGAYLILKTTPLHLPSALVGLFVAVVAALAESVAELVRLWRA